MTMLAVVVDVPAWLGIVMLIFGGLGVGGAGWAIAKSKGIESSVGVMADINAELRASNEELRSELSDEKVRRAEDKHDCEKEIAEMRGQLAAVTSTLGESIGREVGQRVGAEVISLLRDQFADGAPDSWRT